MLTGDLFCFVCCCKEVKMRDVCVWCGNVLMVPSHILQCCEDTRICFVNGLSHKYEICCASPSHKYAIAGVKLYTVDS